MKQKTVKKEKSRASLSTLPEAIVVGQSVQNSTSLQSIILTTEYQMCYEDTIQIYKSLRIHT